MRLPLLPAVVLLHLLGGLGLPARAAAEEQPARAVLHLANGGLLPGELCASDDAKVVRWRSPSFAEPLAFPLNAVHSLHYAPRGAQPKPVGEFCFELVGDDLVYGNLRGVTEDALTVDAGRYGLLQLRREQVRRFYRWQGADVVFLGPNGLGGWKDAAPAPQWREEGGQLATDQAGASLFADLGLPEKALIDVKLSWKAKPDFILALGVEERSGTGPAALQLEVWDDQVVAVTESTRDADVAAVHSIGAGEGRVHLHLGLDQQQGGLILLSSGGKQLATLHTSGKKRTAHSGVRLTNTKGDVRLETLRITRWNGQAPGEIREDETRVHRTDGSVVYGRLTAFDAAAKAFTLTDGAKETRIAQDTVTQVVLMPPRRAEQDAKELNAGRAPSGVRFAYRDGSRFCGELTGIEATHVTLADPGMKEPVQLPLAALRSFLLLQSGEKPRLDALAGKVGRLEMDGLSLKGRLAAGSARPGASCLAWLPELALEASPLLPNASGRIVFREHPSPVANAPAMMPGVRQVIRANGGVVRLQAVMPQARPGPMHLVLDNAAAPLPFSGRPSLHLRSGDTIPCTVIGIDEKGVRLRTPLSDATFVAHEKIKGVELSPLQTSTPLDERKRERLLTLPRMQKDLPPTQLICSKNGDFLRGRVVEMDDKRLKVEVRLETREIPRERVAQIIWLHADELTAAKPAPPDAAPANRVQAVRADGNRLTFVAERADTRTISGTSEILGACRVELAEVDQLLFGTAIEESAARLAYHQWKLHPAPEPKFVQAEAGAGAEGQPTGTESPLVGQAAFPFRLEMLDGTPFSLAGRKGKIVVLDFWATWCGPCMQTMPLIDAVVREFAGQPVELIAVNLEEQREQVKSMLERHKLQVAVALDRDGAVAAKYSVTAIPQTVVIDRDGKVVRLFVGGGKKTAEALRSALQELTGTKPMPAATP